MRKWNWGAWPWTTPKSATTTDEFTFSTQCKHPTSYNAITRFHNIVALIADLGYEYGDQAKIKWSVKNSKSCLNECIIVKIVADNEVFCEISEKLRKEASWEFILYGEK